MNKMTKPQQAKDLAKNIFKAAAGLVTGKLKILDSQEKKRRLQVCYQCHNFDHEKQQCMICECRGRFLELKASVNLWQCPEGKWEVANIADGDKGYCVICKGAIVEITNKDDKTYGQCVNGHYASLRPEQAVRNTALDPRVQQQTEERNNRND